MEFLYMLFIILHFVGLASLLGGFLVQMKPIAKGKGVVNAAMVHGALTQLVTGLLLVGIAEMGDGTVNHMKIGIKLAVLIVITVLVFVYRKKTAVPSWVLWAIG
ncbi:MAG TPA: hypothetical protein PK781_04940, partial [Terrimesophilobacter sp.]|nr:hypothetical protein [Terrimesophilobacter sp.]